MKKLTLKRSFSAPIEKVWEALTNVDEPKKLEQSILHSIISKA